MTKTLSAAAALILVTGLGACAAPADDDAGTQTNTGGGGKNGGGKKEGGKGSGGPDNSTATKNGPLTWGDWQTVGPLQLKEDALDMYGLTFRVKNRADSKETGIYTVTVLKGNKVLTTLDCTTGEIGPGQVGTAECFGTDDFKPGWTEITVEDAF